MFTEAKVTEIFCLADDFIHFFDLEMKKCVIEEEIASKKRKYHPPNPSLTLDNPFVIPS